MPTSEVSICNTALGMIGAQPITSLTEDKENARKCNVIFGQYRDELLGEHKWAFATKRSPELSQAAAGPEMEYNYRYTLPSDYLDLVDVYDGDDVTEEPYVIEENHVVTNQADDLYVRYVCKITDPAKFPQGFVKTLTFKLAATLAVSMGLDKTLADRLELKYERALRHAITQDARLGTRTATDPATSWQSAGR